MIGNKRRFWYDKRLIKYTVSAAVLATMIQATPTFASPVAPPVTQGQIDATQGQINDFETKIQQLDDRISSSMEKSEKLNNQIKTQQGKLKQPRLKLKQLKSH